MQKAMHPRRGAGKWESCLIWEFSHRYQLTNLLHFLKRRVHNHFGTSQNIETFILTQRLRMYPKPIVYLLFPFWWGDIYTLLWVFTRQYGTIAIIDWLSLYRAVCLLVTFIWMQKLMQRMFFGIALKGGKKKNIVCFFSWIQLTQTAFSLIGIGWMKLACHMMKGILPVQATCRSIPIVIDAERKRGLDELLSTTTYVVCPNFRR